MIRIRLTRLPAIAVVAVLLIPLVGACANVQVQTDFDPSTNFAAWRAYAWYPERSAATGDARLDNPLVHKRIEAAVDRVLAARGYKKSANAEPDFFVSYHLSSQEQINVETVNRGHIAVPHGRNWNSAGWAGADWTESFIDQYEEGTLMLDFLDPTSRNLAWRGIATQRLPATSDAERTTQRVNEVVEAILAEFPADS